MTPVKPDWIVIANATRARILARERGQPMAVVKPFSHPEGRGKVSDLADEHERFATKLGAWLERAAEQGTYRSLALLASSPFLGELKAELGLAAQRLLTVTHDVDLTAVGPAELEKRILRELAR